MLFNDIPGNFSIKRQLVFSVKNNRIAHAQLFSGKSGSAKLALALAYARFLNCEKKSEEDSCGKCASCTKYNSLSSPDLHLVFPVLKLNKEKKPISDHFVGKWCEFILKNTYGSLNQWINTLGVESKKGEQGTIYKDDAVSILKKLSLKNFESSYRVVLIWMPEKMNITASNKLLKIIEEPPSGTVFILVSENAEKLLPTIYSRLQIIKVGNFSNQDMLDFFSKRNIMPEKIIHLRNLLDADLGKMIHLLENGLEELDLFGDFSSLMRLSYKCDIIGISRWVDSISTIGRRRQKLFISYTLKMLRACLISNFGDNKLLKNSDKESKFISNFAPFIHEENSVLIIDVFEDALRAVDRNANAKILFFDLSLQMIKFLKVKRKFVKN